MASRGRTCWRGVALSVLAAADEEVCLGIRSPSSVEHRGRVTSVTVAPSPEGHEGRDDAVLLLRRRPDESLEINGLSVSTSVSPAGDGHIAHLHVRTPRLADTISLSVLSASGVEARIGVDAPETLRVYRKEVWLDVREANVSAALWSPDDLAALSATVPPGTWGRDEPASAGTAGP